jgi:hypothetical protein
MRSREGWMAVTDTSVPMEGLVTVSLWRLPATGVDSGGMGEASARWKPMPASVAIFRAIEVDDAIR